MRIFLLGANGFIGRHIACHLPRLFALALATPAVAEPQLLFASGFEGVTTGPQIDDLVAVVGRDTTTGYSWPITVLGASGSGIHFIQDDNHKAVDTRIVDITGHTGRPTRARYSEENYAYNATQAPYEILDIRDGRLDLYIRYWVKLDSRSFGQPDSWRTFFE